MYDLVIDLKENHDSSIICSHVTIECNKNKGSRFSKRVTYKNWRPK